MNIIRSLFTRRVLCRKCGRPLTNKKDRARGISARCLAKEEAHKAEQIASTKPMPTMYVLEEAIKKHEGLPHDSVGNIIENITRRIN